MAQTDTAKTADRIIRDHFGGEDDPPSGLEAAIEGALDDSISDAVTEALNEVDSLVAQLLRNA